MTFFLERERFAIRQIFGGHDFLEITLEILFLTTTTCGEMWIMTKEAARIFVENESDYNNDMCAYHYKI